MQEYLLSQEYNSCHSTYLSKKIMSHDENKSHSHSSCHKNENPNTRRSFQLQQETFCHKTKNTTTKRSLCKKKKISVTETKFHKNINVSMYLNKLLAPLTLDQKQNFNHRRKILRE